MADSGEGSVGLGGVGRGVGRGRGRPRGGMAAPPGGGGDTIPKSRSEEADFGDEEFSTGVYKVWMHFFRWG